MDIGLKIISLSVVLFFCAVIPCIGISRSVTLTDEDTLSYLVRKSDLIAIVQITGGTDDKRVLSFSKIPVQVDARILSLIKGAEKRKAIKIDSTPRNYPPGVLKSSVVLRNGKHLVFLSQDENSYKPTTGFSIFDIMHNIVHPIWKQGANSNEISAGYNIGTIVGEIEDEMKQ